jgi:hypothetical protein
MKIMSEPIQNPFRAKLSISVLFLLYALIFSAPSYGQVQTGTPPFGSFDGGPDVINLANLNAHFTVPILGKPGRGMPFDLNLTYDSALWNSVTSGSTVSWQPTSNFGWDGSEIRIGHISYSQTTQMRVWGAKPNQGHETITTRNRWVYTDGFGTTF